MKSLNKYLIECPAKANLFLNITGRNDNLHTLKLVNQSISLNDYLEVEVNNCDNIILKSNNKSIPLDISNSIYKAIFLMKKEYNISYGLKVNIIKNIPLAAGLGGESTDAAGIILFLNQLCNLNLSMEKLFNIALKVGSDVPFCIHGGSAYINEKNNIFDYNIKSYYYVVVKPSFGLITKNMYDIYDEKCIYLKKDIMFGYNDFEQIVPEELIQIKQLFLKNSAVFANVSGSGSAVIGAFESKCLQEKMFEQLKNVYETYMAYPSKGIKVRKKTI